MAVPRKVEDVAEVWALERDCVLRFYHEWSLGDVPVVSAVSYDEAGNGYVKTMDRDGLEVLVQ